MEKDSEKYKEEAKNRGLVCKKNDENKILAASNQTEETSEIIKIKPLSENLARLKKDRGVSNPGQLLKTIDKINENFKIEIQEKNLKIIVIMLFAFAQIGNKNLNHIKRKQGIEV